MGGCRGGRGGVRETAGARSIGRTVEKGGAGNKDVRPGGHKGRRVFRAGPAVHLKERSVRAATVQQRAGGADFVEAGGQEGLP